MDLAYNKLDGEIPAELGSLSNLVEMDLAYNKLDGEIPAELGSLSNLERLYLSGLQKDSQLTGCIPSELQDVPKNDLGELGLPFC